MDRIQLESRKGEKGFTLVELAIVMIIIGLLIVGILKGQEMIANAQVSSTITQLKATDAATSTFRDIYNAFPGDMANAATRLRNCNAGNCNNGDGDGRLDIGVGAANNAANEGAFFFTQMAAADLISGVDSQTLDIGSVYPSAPVGGGFFAGHTNPNGGATSVTSFTGANMRPGHYLVLNGIETAVTNTSGVLNAPQAARIDRKLDDGLPLAGSVQSNANCGTATDYNEDQPNLLCPIAVRVQG